MTTSAKPKSLFGRAARFLGVLLLVCIMLLAGTAWRLTTGPIALPDWATDLLERRANEALAPVSLSLSQVALDYDTSRHSLGMVVRQVAVDEGAQQVLTIPEARVVLDARSLVTGRVRPREVDLRGLALDLGRDADGRLSLSFGMGGEGGLPQDWAAILPMLDAVLDQPVLADLDDIRIDGITLRLHDAITGLEQEAQDGTLAVTRDGDGTRLSLSSQLPVGGARSADLAIGVARRDGGGGAEATLALLNVPLAYLAEVAPNITALSLVDGTASATASFTLAEDGTPGTLRGRLDLTDPRLVDRPDRLRLDRGRLAFSWVPGSDRIGLDEIFASSEEVQLRSTGQVILEDGLIGPIQTQFRFDEVIFDPDEMFDERVAFDVGVFEARLTQSPLSVRIGQGVLSGPSGTVRMSGSVAFPADGLDGGLRLAIPEIDVVKLRALWPQNLQPQSRRWFFNNMLAGTASNVVAAVRLKPGQEADISANFNYRDGMVRFMRFMPPAEQAVGSAQLDGFRLSMRVDSALVPALGPGEERGADDGLLRVGPSTFVIEDARQRPVMGRLKLRASGDVADTMTLLDNRPLRLLQRLKKSRDFASGTADAVVEVYLPLRPGNAPADIDWSVTAKLFDVQSDQIVPGRRIAAQTLDMTATPEAVEIGGDLTFDGIGFVGTFRQALPPPGTDPIDPDAPPPPPRPLPEPGKVTGTARVSPDDLERLGIKLSALTLSGTTSARVDVSLPQGQSPTLEVRSNLAGMSVGLPALSWSKTRGAEAQFALSATLGARPDVTALSLDAAGLNARGAISFNDSGQFQEARFDTVDLGWFRGPATVTSRGAGRPAAISIRGGNADLRQALLRGGEGGDGQGGAPLDVALNRLTVTEGITLTDLRARLQSGGGSFSGRVNGDQPIEGVLAPRGGGSVVQIRSTDAGGVLRSADLFKDARGGALNLTLSPTGQAGIYQGALRMSDLRVRNAPALASLLQALSVVGILEQLGGEGLFFQTVESDFTLRPRDIVVRRASAVGPSMSITADGVFDSRNKIMDMQGVVSPIYLVNGLFGALFARRDEGLFGFTYTLRGPVAAPAVSVNPLSILTPGVFRDIFRRPPPGG